MISGLVLLGCMKPAIPAAVEAVATIPHSDRAPGSPSAFVATDPGLGEITSVQCKGEFAAIPAPGGIEVTWQRYPVRHAALPDGFPGGYLRHGASCHVEGATGTAVVPVRFTVTVPPA